MNAAPAGTEAVYSPRGFAVALAVTAARAARAEQRRAELARFIGQVSS